MILYNLAYSTIYVIGTRSLCTNESNKAHEYRYERGGEKKGKTESEIKRRR